MSHKNKLIHIVVLFVMVMSLALSPVQSAAAQEGDGLNREVNAESGKVSFIGSETGEPVSIMNALGLPSSGDVPTDPARALVNRYGVEFGLRNPANELMEARMTSQDSGRRTVRYQQTYQGIPVFAGELIVNTDDLGNLYSISGEVSDGLSLSTESAITMDDARDMALGLVAKGAGGTAADYVSTDPELMVYDASLIAPDSSPAALVWKMEVHPMESGKPVNQLVMLDAQTGRIALNINQVDTAWHASSKNSTTKPTGSFAPLYSYPDPSTPIGATITTRDGNNNVNPGDDTQLCSNSLSTCTGGTDPDGDSAHFFAGLVWGLYNAKHGRNSINGAGMPIVSIVHFDSGYANAFWDNNTMSYGDGYGFAYADDVIGHELTHGVTEYESNLVYYYQSGAMNESFSDVWGEYFDQTNNQGTDTPAVKWLMGEDVSDLGVIRNMADPTAFGDPDSMTSPMYYKDELDNGGVHTNSGVNNKAAYLMVDGGVFGGKTVQGIGWDKTAAIYYEVQTNLLGTGSNYSDLYYALQQACKTLTGGPQGITLADCVNVTNALDAVKMNTSTIVKHQVTAPLCPAGQTPNSTAVFEDKMEGTLSTNWNLSARWAQTTAVASSPVNSMYGNDFANLILESASMKTGVVIPANAYLHFDHAYDFEPGWDGGVVEYSANGGAWTDIASLYSAGVNYPGTISGISGNALGGRKGFTGTSLPYHWNPPSSLVSTRYNLNALSGKTVRFRFLYATDSTYYYYGWYIDDFKIYTCIGTPALPVLKIPANNSLVTDYTPLLDWNDTTPISSFYEVQLATDAAFTSIVEEDTLLPTSQYQVVTPLAENSKYYWRVRAFNSENSTNNWTAAFNFRTVYLPPVHSSPGDGSSPMTRRPTFIWTNPNTGIAPLNYTLQVSTSNTFATIAHTGTSTSTSYTPGVDLPGGTLYWRVRINGGNGPSAFTSAWSINIPGSVPVFPTLVSPNNATLFTTYQPTFAWTVPVGTSVDHFNIQFDNDSKFGSPDVIDSTPNSTPSYTPGSPLPGNVTLYWRVQTVAPGGAMSAWSTARNVKMAIVPPSNLSPADEAPVTELRPLFDWDNVAGATGYTIQFSLNSTFSPVLHTGNPTVSQYIPAVDLPKGATVYWRVQTKGLIGPSAFVPAVAADRNIILPTIVPMPPTLASPAQNFLTADFSPALSWSMSATSPAYDHFIVQIDDDMAFGSPSQYSAPSSPFSPPDQTANTKWYWRVRAVNLAGDMGNWSVSRYFRTTVLPPSNLTLIGGSPATELRPLFDWDEVTGATGYTIQFSTNSSFSPIAHTGNPTTSQYIPTVDLPKNATLYWRVQSKAVNGPSAFTQAGSTFLTPATIPAVPGLSSPALNFLTTDYTPTLTWTMAATPAYNNFYVQIDDNSDFSSPFFNGPTGSAAHNFTAPTLTSNTKWYWRVRGANGSTLGNWSTSRYFRTALEVPVPTSPINGSSPYSYWPTYNWNDVPGATGYNLQISFYSSFSPVLLNVNTVTSSYDPMTGICGSAVYWRVRATGSNGPSLWSPTFVWYSPSCP